MDNQHPHVDSPMMEGEDEPTPGPWEARPVDACKVIVIAQVGKMYPHAHVTTPTAAPEMLTPQTRANAALIAAAPDLLAALEELLEHADMDAVDEETQPAVDRARAAIQKARGR